MQTVLQQRQKFLPQYRELFQVLFRIGDNEVVNRVINAINGNDTCIHCQTNLLKSSNTKYMNSSTQTDEDVVPLATNIVSTSSLSKEEISKAPVREERVVTRRKRKRKVPEVIKRAADEKLNKNKIPLSLARAGPVPKNKNRRISTFSDITFNSILDELPCDDDALLALISPQITQDVRKQWENEWNQCLEFDDDGLLPIHRAVKNNEMYRLKRQLLVFRFKEIDINDLYTKEDESILEIAIKANCFPSIIKILVDNKIQANLIDSDSNNILHLILIHMQDDAKKVLELILPLVNPILLGSTNDNGATPLHIAVRDNRFKCLRIMLDYVDAKFLTKPIIPSNDSLETKDDFLKYYSKEVQLLEEREFNLQKAAILNKTDMKDGRTALYHAVNLKLNHIVYLLLNHLADPRVADHSGMDPQSYDAEHGKDKNISEALHNIAQFLKQHCE